MRSLVVVVVALTAAAPALPCSGSGPPTLEDMTLSVADGGVVPTNFVVFGSFTGIADGSTWWLRRLPDGEPGLMVMNIENGRRRTRLTPNVDVEAGATYELSWSPDDTPPEPDDTERDPVVFTTSADDDSTPPASPVLTSHVAPELSGYNQNDDCPGGSTGTAVYIDIDDDEADDDIGSYEVRNAIGEVVDVGFVSGFNLVDARVGVLEQKGGREEYAVVAIDHAGNESEPTLVPADLGCEGSCNSGFDVVGVSALAMLFAFRRRR